MIIVALPIVSIFSWKKFQTTHFYKKINPRASFSLMLDWIAKNK